jgi:uncharacterized coiled-coil DUF342 family protein
MGLVMTWIAACTGQRGIYQELIMTDEERQKLVADLRQISPDLLWNRAAYACNDAADEIERLERELNSTLGLLYQESERRAKTEQETERLGRLLKGVDDYVAERCLAAADEIERLAEQLRISNKALSMCSDECNELYDKLDKYDPRFVISVIEGRGYVQKRNTDTVLAEFDL